MNRLSLILSSMFSRIVYGRKHVRISPFAYVASDCAFEGENYIDRFCSIHATSMGRYSYVGSGSSVYNCSIGRYCSIASTVKIGLGIHPVDHVSTSPLFYSRRNVFKKKWAEADYAVPESRKVFIGNDVWIGVDAKIMGGVNVGDGAIIGAGAVVTKDVPSFSIVGGIPARVIRDRFTPDIARKIAATKWWDYPEDCLKKHCGDFRDPDIFLSAVDNGKNCNEKTL